MLLLSSSIKSRSHALGKKRTSKASAAPCILGLHMRDCVQTGLHMSIICGEADRMDLLCVEYNGPLAQQVWIRSNSFCLHWAFKDSRNRSSLRQVRWCKPANLKSPHLFYSSGQGKKILLRQLHSSRKWHSTGVFAVKMCCPCVARSNSRGGEKHHAFKGFISLLLKDKRSCC